MDCDATHHSTNGRGWDVRGGLGSACELPCTATGRGQAPQARTEALHERVPHTTTASPTSANGSALHERVPRTTTGRGQAPQARTEAVQERSPPAPPQGGGKPQKRFTSDGPAPPQGGGKPRPYYTRASQAVSSYSRGDPCGRPEMGALLQSALCSRLWGQALPLLYTGLVATLTSLRSRLW